MRFLRRRILHSLFLLVGVSLLCFTLFRMVPGDYVSEMRLNPQISAATLAGLRTQYGLDQPLPGQYIRWLGSVMRGEFGYSFTYNTPVGPLLGLRFKNTLLLALPAMALAWILALGMGCWSAWHRERWQDHVVSTGATVLLIMPDIVIALGLLLLALRSGWFAVGGMVSLNFEQLSFAAKLKDIVAHFTLPVAALTLSSLPVLVRHVRAAVIEVLDAPYTKAARGHGIAGARLVFRHVLPAACNPLVSLLGLSIAGLLSGSLLIEVIMSWPGLGPLLLEAVQARDLYVIIGCVVISTGLLVVGSMLSDVLLFLMDPRIRAEASEK